MIRVVQCDGYRSITQRLSVFRSGKNDILHGTASKLLCSLLSQHPADCICHIALSTSVWAHDSRNSIVKLKFNPIGERFKSLYLNTF